MNSKQKSQTLLETRAVLKNHIFFSILIDQLHSPGSTLSSGVVPLFLDHKCIGNVILCMWQVVLKYSTRPLNYSWKWRHVVRGWSITTVRILIWISDNIWELNKFSVKCGLPCLRVGNMSQIYLRPYWRSLCLVARRLHLLLQTGVYRRALRDGDKWMSVQSLLQPRRL